MKNIKNNANRITVTILSLLLLAAGPFFFAGEFTSYADDSVSTWEELVAAVADAVDDDTITITEDITIPGEESLVIEDKNITIVGAVSGVTIKRKSLEKTSHTEPAYQLGAMVSVKSGTLTLGQNITFSGARSGGGVNDIDTYWWKNDFKEGTRGYFVQVESDGGLVIDGAVFEKYSTWYCRQDNSNNIPAGISPIFIAGDFTMNSGVIRDNLAGMVDPGKAEEGYPTLGNRKTIEDNSFLTWKNGKPAGVNGEPGVQFSSSDWTVSQTTSGGIFIDAQGKNLVMNGGTLTNNKGNAGNLVVAGGTLTIKDGLIEKGIADHFAGGIYIVSSDAEVRMCGGTVSQNVSSMGGGVFPTRDATFFLMGGTIDGNKSHIAGGGILVYSNNVYLLSGHITNNSAPTFGGGIYVYGLDADREYPEGSGNWYRGIDYQYVMTLHNAEIRDNEALSSASDPRIYGSDAHANRPEALRSAETFMAGSGGGVWMCPAGISEFDASTINVYNNSAVNQGNDFHKDAGFDGGILLDFGPHEQLSDWIHTEQTGTWRNHTNGPKYGQPLNLKEATSGGSESLSLDYTGNTKNATDPQLFITNNVSLRGGGLGSNGVVILSDQSNERSIDKGELTYQKTFKDLPFTKMEYEMILADENGDPVQKKDKDGNKKDVVITTFRLFDAEYARNYDTYRKTEGRPEFGQFEASWEKNDNDEDYGKINITFPERFDDISFFDSDSIRVGEKLNIIIREYEVKDNNERGAPVQDRFFSYDAPNYETEVVPDLDQTISIYPGGGCASSSDQGCDEWSCKPGEPQTFPLRYRTYDFKSDAENKEPIEIEKYVNQAVHADIDLNDVFSYDILAYVARDADEVTITDKLGSDLEFAPTNGNVKVYDLGETTDDDGNRELIDSNHLPVYDVSGNEIDNGDVTPSVKQGKEIDKSKYTVSTADNILSVVIKNTLNEEGEPKEGEPQNVTPLRGHYIRIHFDAQISKEKREAIENGTMTYGDFEKTTVDPETVDEDRDEPNKGNDPVKSKEEHSGIANKASYDIKVKNEAKYSDTSNTVTVKPEEPGPQVEKYVNKDVHKDIAVDDEFTYDIMVYVPENADSVKITDKLNDQLFYVSSKKDIASSAVVKKKNNHKVNGTVAKDNGTPIEAKASIKGQDLTVEIEDATAARGKYIQISFKCKLVKGIEYEYVTVTNNGDVIGGADTHKGVPNTGKYQFKVGNEWSSEFDSNTVTVKVKESKEDDYAGNVDDESGVAPDNDNEDEKLKGADTGDESKMMAWVIILMASAGALGTGAVYRRKRTR